MLAWGAWRRMRDGSGAVVQLSGVGGERGRSETMDFQLTCIVVNMCEPKI